jgi:hypothetical protein
LPEWFTGEPRQAEIDAYKGPVSMPSEPAANAPWPNLADVPERPVPKMTPVDRQNEIKSLKEENTAGQAAIKNFNATATPAPKAQPVAEPVKKKTKKKNQKPAELVPPVFTPAPSPASPETAQ